MGEHLQFAVLFRAPGEGAAPLTGPGAEAGRLLGKGMLYREDLRNYHNWRRHRPSDVLKAVKAQGGWAKIFPDKVPLWAHRVRNYFNAAPKQLRLKIPILGHYETFRVKKKGIVTADIQAGFALTGDVYEEKDSDRIWFQMFKVGTLYHYPGEVDGAKKAKSFITPREFMPVFKLIAPDGTGGSCEVCIENVQERRGFLDPLPSGTKTIGKPLEWKSVESSLEIRPDYIGSYNFSETVVMGSKEHEKRDVIPHETYGALYLPPPANQTIDNRTFPAFDQNGRPIGL